MIRFVAFGLFVVVLLLALFSVAAEALDIAPKSGAVLSPRLVAANLVPWRLVAGTWVLEAGGLIALFLFVQGRCGAWFLDGAVAGWLAWIFRGPLLVITIVVATGQPQSPWWRLAIGWWAAYTLCGIALAFLARNLASRRRRQMPAVD